MSNYEIVASSSYRMPQGYTLRTYVIPSRVSAPASGGPQLAPLPPNVTEHYQRIVALRQHYERVMGPDCARRGRPVKEDDQARRARQRAERKMEQEKQR